MSAVAARVFRGCRALTASSFFSSASERPASAAAVRPPKVTTTKAEAAEAKNLRGIMRPMPVSAALSNFPGGTPKITRSGAIKIFWAYIQGLQELNPNSVGLVTDSLNC